MANNREKLNSFRLHNVMTSFGGLAAEKNIAKVVGQGTVKAAKKWRTAEGKPAYAVPFYYAEHTYNRKNYLLVEVDGNSFYDEREAGKTLVAQADELASRLGVSIITDLEMKIDDDNARQAGGGGRQGNGGAAGAAGAAGQLVDGENTTKATKDKSDKQFDVIAKVLEASAGTSAEGKVPILAAVCTALIEKGFVDDKTPFTKKSTYDRIAHLVSIILKEKLFTDMEDVIARCTAPVIACGFLAAFFIFQLDGKGPNHEVYKSGEILRVYNEVKKDPAKLKDLITDRPPLRKFLESVGALVVAHNVACRNYLDELVCSNHYGNVFQFILCSTFDLVANHLRGNDDLADQALFGGGVVDYRQLVTGQAKKAILQYQCPDLPGDSAAVALNGKLWEYFQNYLSGVPSDVACFSVDVRPPIKILTKVSDLTKKEDEEDEKKTKEEPKSAPSVSTQVARNSYDTAAASLSTERTGTFEHISPELWAKINMFKAGEQDDLRREVYKQARPVFVNEKAWMKNAPTPPPTVSASKAKPGDTRVRDGTKSQHRSKSGGSDGGFSNKQFNQMMNFMQAAASSGRSSRSFSGASPAPYPHYHQQQQEEPLFEDPGSTTPYNGGDRKNNKGGRGGRGGRGGGRGGYGGGYRK